MNARNALMLVFLAGILSAPGCKPKKQEPRKTPSPKPRTKPDLAGGATRQPPARKVEPPTAGTKPSSLQTAPSSTGLSKFNPND